MTEDTLELWVDAEITQVNGCDVVNPGPQPLYGGAAYPIKERNKWPAGILWRPAGGKRYPGL